MRARGDGARRPSAAESRRAGPPRRPAEARLPAFLLALLALPSLPAPAAGQAAGGGAGGDADGADPPPPFSVAVRAGFSSPKGDLGDLGDDAYVLALALGRRVSPRVTLLVEGSVEDLERGGRLEPGPSLGGVLGPNIEVWRVMGLASVELTDPLTSRWEVSVQAGAGATIVAADAFAAGDAFTTAEPTLAAGLLTGYDLGRRVTFFARGGGSIWFDGTDPAGENYLAKEVTFTHTLGVRVRF